MLKKGRLVCVYLRFFAVVTKAHQAWIEYKGKCLSRVETTARGWLESFPEPQTYTVLRTQCDAAVALSLHLKRLKDGARHYGARAISDSEVCQAIAAVAPADDAGLVVIAVDGRGCISAIGRQCVTVSEPDPFEALAVAAGPRLDSTIKSSQWCRDRKPLERNTLTGNAFNEVLLTTPSVLLEGLTHNACVLTNEGIIETAPFDVLPGIGLAHALDAAKRLGIPTRRRFPLLSEAQHKWKEVFLTNANALCLPVKSIAFQDLPFSLSFSTAEKEAHFPIASAIRTTMLDDINQSRDCGGATWLERILT